MQSSAKFKVPNGKLLEVKIDYSGSIKNIQILGDFFVHPEEALKGIEDLLVGTDLNEKVISDKVQHFVDSNKIMLVGINAEAIGKVIAIAVNK